MYKLINDMGLVAALRTTGVEPLSVDSKNGVVVFTFEDSDILENLSSQYYSHQLEVGAKMYNEQLKKTKGEVTRLLNQ